MSYNLTTMIEMLQGPDRIQEKNSGVRVDLRRNPLSWRLSLQVTATGSSLNFPLTWQDAPGVLWCCGCFIWGGEVEETNSLWPNHNEMWMYAWECHITHPLQKTFFWNCGLTYQAWIGVCCILILMLTFPQWTHLLVEEWIHAACS